MRILKLFHCMRKIRKPALNTFPKSSTNFELGFSLLDVLVTLTMLSVAGIVAVPQLKSLTTAFNHMNARSYLIQDLKRAQAEAITQGCRGVFVIIGNGSSYSFGCDYLDYDTNVPPSHDSTSMVRDLPGNAIVSVPSSIIFNSRGQAVDVDYIQ